jgi:DNA-binding CsgD family transcriptional regulator
MAQLQPAYVESWDSLEFPHVDARKTEEGQLEPAFLRERVELERGEFLDRGQLVDGWVVTRGFLRVSHAMVGSADNPRAIEVEIARWISENRAADDRDQDWRRRWENRLNERPGLVDALNHEDKAEHLFETAGLTFPQRLAMRQWLDGRPNRQAAQALSIAESTYREHCEKALDKIKALV